MDFLQEETEITEMIIKTPFSPFSPVKMRDLPLDPRSFVK